MTPQIKQAMTDLQEADRRFRSAVFNLQESQAVYEANMREETEASKVFHAAQKALIAAVTGEKL